MVDVEGAAAVVGDADAEVSGGDGVEVLGGDEAMVGEGGSSS
jgi:hypothetical protein